MLFLFKYWHMPDRIKKQQFAFLALLMIVLFSYPLLSVANKIKTIAGVPLLYMYIAVTWIISICLLYYTAEKRDAKNKKGK